MTEIGHLPSTILGSPYRTGESPSDAAASRWDSIKVSCFRPSAVESPCGTDIPRIRRSIVKVRPACSRISSTSPSAAADGSAGQLAHQADAIVQMRD